MASRRIKKGDRRHGKRSRRDTRRAEAPTRTAETAAGSAEAASPRATEATPTAGRPARRWWDRFPGRLERELEDLAEAGYEPRHTINDDGRLHVEIQLQLGGRKRTALIRYPDLYPYFRFEVFAPVDAGLTKHQNPYEGNLCLLDQSSAAWSVDDTAAVVLTTQVGKIQAANEFIGPAPHLEVPQPEPVSTYLPTLPRSTIVVPAEAFAPREPRVLRIALRVDDPDVRGFVTAVDGRRTQLPPLVQAFRPTRELDVNCLHLAAPPVTNNVRNLFADLVARGIVREPQLAPGQIRLDAVSFPEEVTYGRPPERGWTFLIWRGVPSGIQGNLVRAERYDAGEQGLRLGSAGGLWDATVALVGLGGIGAPIAHLLLQMRVGELRLLDNDSLSIGNSVRWPLGFAYSGLPKTDALASFAQANYPESRVKVSTWRLGGSAIGHLTDEDASFGAVIDGAQVVIDATAELGVQLFLTDAARERGVTAITVETREGGYGGVVARYRATTPGCYRCLKLHQRDGRFLPPRDVASGRTQPRGCSSPTFTGAPFDLVPLSAQAARLASQTVSLSPMLPDTEENLSIYFARAGNDGAVKQTPRWEHHVMEPHPDCPIC